MQFIDLNEVFYLYVWEGDNLEFLCVFRKPYLAYITLYCNQLKCLLNWELVKFWR